MLIYLWHGSSMSKYVAAFFEIAAQRLTTANVFIFLTLSLGYLQMCASLQSLDSSEYFL